MNEVPWIDDWCGQVWFVAFFNLPSDSKAVNEAIKVYQSTKQKAETERMPVTAMDIMKK